MMEADKASILAASWILSPIDPRRVGVKRAAQLRDSEAAKLRLSAHCSLLTAQQPKTIPDDLRRCQRSALVRRPQLTSLVQTDTSDASKLLVSELWSQEDMMLLLAIDCLLSSDHRAVVV